MDTRWSVWRVGTLVAESLPWIAEAPYPNLRRHRFKTWHEAYEHALVNADLQWRFRNPEKVRAAALQHLIESMA